MDTSTERSRLTVMSELNVQNVKSDMEDTTSTKANTKSDKLLDFHNRSVISSKESCWLSSCNESTIANNLDDDEDSSSTADTKLLGSLTMESVKDAASARRFREKYLGERPFNLALFPASCSPPTKQHMDIVRRVTSMPFVDQCWIDVNQTSFTKPTLMKTYTHRLLMVQQEVSKINNADTCILSKNLEICVKDAETRKKNTKKYWETCRVLAGPKGKLSWVIGGDILKSMVWWKDTASIGLESIDNLIVFSRTISREKCKAALEEVMNDGGYYWRTKAYFIVTGDISSTKAREALTTLMSSLSLETLQHLIENPEVLKDMIGWQETDSLVSAEQGRM